MAPLLEVHDLTLRRDDGTGSAIFHDLSLEVHDGEVLVCRGESGCGKTTLLKCIAELTVFQKGEILLRGRTPQSYGIPYYRTRVQYVPQRPSLLPGTPLQFLTQLRSLAARKKRTAELEAEGKGDEVRDPLDLAAEWGVERHLWMRDWATLSGGEGQRIALAVAIGLGGADVILLDEPTSALDAECANAVERTLISMLPPAPIGAPPDSTKIPRLDKGLKALLWITHSDEQAERVGTRTLNLTRFRE